MLYDIYVHGPPTLSLSSSTPSSSSSSSSSLLCCKRQALDIHSHPYSSSSSSSSVSSCLAHPWLALVTHDTLLVKHQVDDYVEPIVTLQLPTTTRHVQISVLDSGEALVAVTNSNHSVLLLTVRAVQHTQFGHGGTAGVSKRIGELRFFTRILPMVEIPEHVFAGKMKSAEGKYVPHCITGIILKEGKFGCCLKLIVFFNHPIAVVFPLTESFLVRTINKEDFEEGDSRVQEQIKFGIIPMGNSFRWISSVVFFKQKAIMVALGMHLTQDSSCISLFIVEDFDHEEPFLRLQTVSVEYPQSEVSLKKSNEMDRRFAWLLYDLKAYPEIVHNSILLAEVASQRYINIYSFDISNIEGSLSSSGTLVRDFQSGEDEVYTEFAWWSSDIFALATNDRNLYLKDLNDKNLLGNNPEHFSGKISLFNCSSPLQKRLFLIEDNSFVVEKRKQWTDLVTEIDDLDQIFDAELNSKQHQFQLLSLCNVSPEEFLKRKIREGEFELALLFAKKYGLDADQIYQRQWRESSVNIDSIYLYLKNIKDNMWVLNECVTRNADSEGALDALLLYGLSLCSKDLLDRLELSERKIYYLYRILLLRIRKLLKTFCIIHEFYPKAFVEFCGGQSIMSSDHIFSLALKYAKASNFDNLSKLFDQHYFELWPRRLEVLDNICESSDPSSYESLLPKLSSEVIAIDSDWVNDSDILDCLCQSEINSVFAWKYFDLSTLKDYARTLKRMQNNEVENFAALDLSLWYIKRIHEIDERTGMISNCYKLCLFGKGNLPNFIEIDTLLENLKDLYSITYSSNVDMSLQEYELLSPLEKLCSILKESSPLTIVSDLYEKCKDMISRNSNPADLIRNFLLHKSREQLDVSLEVLFHLGKQLNLEELKVFLSAESWITLLEECVVQSETQHSLNSDTSRKLIKLARDNLGKVQNFDQRERAASSVSYVENLFLTFETFSNYGESKSIKFFNDIKKDSDDISAFKALKGLIRKAGKSFASKKAQSKLVNRVISGVADTSVESKWRSLCFEIREMQKLVLNMLSRDQCSGLILEAILGFEYFAFARSLLEEQSEDHYFFISQDHAFGIIIAASNEYFDSASCAADPAMNKARECVKLLDHFGEIQGKMHILYEEESQLIEALDVLERFRVIVVPYDVRSSKNRMEYITKVLDLQGADLFQDFNEDASLGYFDLTSVEKEILHLGGLLGFTTAEQQNEIRLEIANFAFKCNQLERAKRLCLDLLQMLYEPAWELCYRISQSLSSIGSERAVILGHVLSNCPVEQIDHVLNDWKSSVDMNASYSPKTLQLGQGPVIYPMIIAKISEIIRLDELQSFFDFFIPEKSHMTDYQMSVLEFFIRFSVTFLDFKGKLESNEFQVPSLEAWDRFSCNCDSFSTILDEIIRLHPHSKVSDLANFGISLLNLFKKNLGISIEDLDSMISDLLPDDFIVRGFFQDQLSGNLERMERILNYLSKEEELSYFETGILLCKKSSVSLAKFVYDSLLHAFVETKSLPKLQLKLESAQAYVSDIADYFLQSCEVNFLKLNGLDYERLLLFSKFSLACSNHSSNKEFEKLFSVHEEALKYLLSKKRQFSAIDYHKLLNSATSLTELSRLAKLKIKEDAFVLLELVRILKPILSHSVDNLLSDSLICKLYAFEFTIERFRTPQKIPRPIEEFLESNTYLLEKLTPEDSFAYFREIGKNIGFLEENFIILDVQTRYRMSLWGYKFRFPFSSDMVSEYKQMLDFLFYLKFVEAFFLKNNYLKLGGKVSSSSSISDLYDVLLKSVLLDPDFKNSSSKMPDLINILLLALADVNEHDYGIPCTFFSAASFSVEKLLDYAFSKFCVAFLRIEYNPDPFIDHDGSLNLKFWSPVRYELEDHLKLPWFDFKPDFNLVCSFFSSLLESFIQNHSVNLNPLLEQVLSIVKDKLVGDDRFLIRAAVLDSLSRSIEKCNREELQDMLPEIFKLKNYILSAKLNSYCWKENIMDIDVFNVEEFAKLILEREILSERDFAACITLLSMHQFPKTFWFDALKASVKSGLANQFALVVRSFFVKKRILELSESDLFSFYDLWTKSDSPNALFAAFSVGFLHGSSIVERVCEDLMSPRGEEFYLHLASDMREYLNEWIIDSGCLAKLVANSKIFKGVTKCLLKRWRLLNEKRESVPLNAEIGSFEYCLADLVLSGKPMQSAAILLASLPISFSVRSVSYSFYLLKRFFLLASQNSPSKRYLKDALQIVSKHLESAN